MSNSTQKTVAIFGASGAQGAPVVQQALEVGYNVRAIARNAERVQSLHPEATAISADLADEDALISALTGVDAAFLHFPRPEGPEDNQNWATAFFTAAHKVGLPLLVFATGGPSGQRFPSSVIVDATTQGMESVLSSGIPAIVLQGAVYLENLQPTYFSPNLRSDGQLDYPPVPRDLKFQWTSHFDQAKIAVAAFERSDLAGRAFEIGTPGAVTGDELTTYLSEWIDLDVTFDPMTPADFGKRVGEAFNSEGAAFALADLYGSIEQLHGDEMIVDTASLEATFHIKLKSVAEHIRSWPKE